MGPPSQGPLEWADNEWAAHSVSTRLMDRTCCSSRSPSVFYELEHFIEIANAATTEELRSSEDERRPGENV